jgi:NADH:quinone reductase (non-electrogenic)
MASLKDTKGQIVPGLAAAAIQMGRAVAKNIDRDLNGEPRVPFTYRDKGSLATIGKHRAVAEIGRWHLSGLIAWLLWGVVHIFLLIGFRNRFAVMREWLWAYITEQFSAQLITGNVPEVCMDSAAPLAVNPPNAPTKSVSAGSSVPTRRGHRIGIGKPITFSSTDNCPTQSPSENVS